MQKYFVPNGSSHVLQCRIQNNHPVDAFTHNKCLVPIFQARSDSMASVYSGAGEGRCCRSVVVTGEVEFALQYDYKHLTFEVHVTKCKNLAPVDVKRKRSDP